MSTRIIVGGIIATVALAGSALALGDGSERRVALPAAGQEVPRPPQSLANAQRAVLEATQSKVKCRTLRCINKSLNTLAKAFTTLTGCMSHIDVARYSGYMYSNDGGANEFQTTALDTTPAGTPGTKVAILIC